jgi:hypothetical protein
MIEELPFDVGAFLPPSFSGDPMQLSWKRGLLRVWAVLAIIWVAFFGWREYSAHWWWMDPVVHADGECWDRRAKWSDGKPFDQGDAFSNEAPPGSINQRDRWRDSVREKIRACEDAKPLVERSIGWVGDNFSSVKTFAPFDSAASVWAVTRRPASKIKAAKRRPSRDAALLDLADRFIAADIEVDRLNDAVNAMEEVMLRGPGKKALAAPRGYESAKRKMDKANRLARKLEGKSSTRPQIR